MMPSPILRRTVDLSGFPDLVVIYLGMRVNRWTGLKTLVGTGKRVKVKLLSGQDLDGKVAKVGTQALVLTELSGMEFFDATVRLDQVAAVIVRRGK